MESCTFKKVYFQRTLDRYPGEVFWEESLESTNEKAIELALRGKECIVIADEQTKGAGRLGREFSSKRGGMYMSMSICLNGLFAEDQQPDLSLTLHFPLVAALAVSDAISETTDEVLGVDIRPDIKWPNDIMVNEKKIGGILCKAVQAEGLWFIIVGMGINVCNELPSDLEKAGTIKDIVGGIGDFSDYGEKFIQTFASRLCKDVMKRFEKGISEAGALLDEIEERCITIGKRVDVPERGVKGTAVQIGDDGSLCIETEDKELVYVKSGDVVIYT